MQANEVLRLESGGVLSLYVPPKKVRGVVLICPGGGYQWVAPREGEPVARAFNAGGWAAAVLEYTCYQGKPLGKLPLKQAGEAMHVLRQRFADMPALTCGFSAGGHLAAALGVHWKEEGLPRPDGLILCYPVITAGKYAHADSIRHLAGDSEMDYWSLEKHVTQDTPPTFIWHTVTDETVPMQNSILFTESLAEKGVPVELHLYPNGKHGLSLATKEVEECEKGRFADAHVADWFRLCLNWMERLA